LYNSSVIIYDIRNTSTATMGITGTGNVKGAVEVKQARLANYTTTHASYYASASTDSSSLSGGAIAGIIIGVIVLLCCCGVLGGCYKSKGHWEKVWVTD
jgi:hypothetical protein